MTPENPGGHVPDRRGGTNAVTIRIDADDGATPTHRPSERYQLLVWPFPDRGEVLVGRAEEADIRIDSAAVSRRHARLFIEDDNVHLVDLESQNGTRVNGERLAGRRRLVYEDIVTFGARPRRPGMAPPPPKPCRSRFSTSATEKS